MEVNSIFAENVIVLKSVWGKVNQKYYINPCKDPKTGRYPDCVRRVDANGDMVLSEKDKNENVICIPEDRVFILEDGTTFNLDDPWQKAEWDCVKHCKLIAMSRDQRDEKGNLIIDGTNATHTRDYYVAMGARNGLAELYVYKPGVESERKVSRKKIKTQAMSYIFDDSFEGLLIKAKLLGQRVDNLPLADVQDYLIEEAERNPQKIISLYVGDDLHLRILLMEAKEKHVIVNKGGVYWYNDMMIAGSDEAVLTWMKMPKNFKILELIKKDTYPGVFDSDSISVKEEVKDEPVAVETEKKTIKKK